MIISMDGTSNTRQNPLSDINSADIKSIEILKDAAATALYGSRAANGVIMITTNSGQKGKAKISYNGSYTISTPTNMIEAMDAEQYVDLKNLAVSNTASRQEDKGFYDQYAYGLMYDSNGNVIDTDWSDLLFQTGNSLPIRKTLRPDKRLRDRQQLSRCGRTVSPGLQGKAGSRC